MQEKNRDEEEVEPEKEKPMDDENIKNKKTLVRNLLLIRFQIKCKRRI